MQNMQQLLDLWDGGGRRMHRCARTGVYERCTRDHERRRAFTSACRNLFQCAGGAAGDINAGFAASWRQAVQPGTDAGRKGRQLSGNCECQVVTNSERQCRLSCKAAAKPSLRAACCQDITYINGPCYFVTVSHCGDIIAHLCEIFKYSECWGASQIRGEEGHIGISCQRSLRRRARRASMA